MTCSERGPRKDTRVAGVAMALALALAAATGAGCAATSDTSGGGEVEAQAGASQDVVDEQGDGTEGAEATSQPEGDQAADAATDPDVFDDACTDRYGDPTIYALSVLKGSQLATLLQGQSFAWSTRELLWMKEDGSAVLAVRGVGGENLTEEQALKLGPGTKTKKASYRLVTSHYSSLERAFKAVTGSAMTCEDSTFTDTAGVAVVNSPSGARVLVLMNVNEGVFVFSVFGEPAIKAGALEEVTGMSLGNSIDEAFLALAGRVPAVEQLELE